MTERARLVVSTTPLEPGPNYGDTCLQLWPDGSKSVCYRLGGNVSTQHEVGRRLLLWDPPAHIVDPPAYFADLIACTQLETHIRFAVRFEVLFRAKKGFVVMPPQPLMCTATALAVYFDPLPDPRLVLGVTVRYVDGRVYDISIRTCDWLCDDRYYSYARDMFVAVHRDIVARSDAHMAFAMVLRSTRTLEFGMREIGKIRRALAPLGDLQARFQRLPLSTRLGLRFRHLVSVNSTVGAERQWQALRQHIARATSSRVVRVLASDPGESFAIDWDMDTLQYRFRAYVDDWKQLSWQSTLPRALSIALALGPLRLPPYVVVWILQWISELGTQRELRLLRLVESVTRRCTGLADRRRVCEVRGLRRRQ